MEKPRLVPVGPPEDPAMVREDLSKPYPIQYGFQWYVQEDEKKLYEERRS